MSQRQERFATRPDDDQPEPELETPERPGPVQVEEEDESTEFDLDIAPFETRASEPAEPMSAATTVFRGEDPLREFSDNARKRYHLEVSAFAADLRKQSLVHMRTQGGDNVSGRNVDSAAYFLRSYRANGFLKHLGAIGGLLIGLGAQSLGSMVEKGVYTTGGVLWGVSTTVVGAALFTWHATRDRS